MIGTGIKYFRKRRKINQDVFAKKMNISQSHVSKIERNACYPDFKSSKKASKILKVPIPVLFWFGMKPEDFPNKDIARVIKPKIDTMILSLLKI
jgi:transcriptional regulator with XRE-family HTH domain